MPHRKHWIVLLCTLSSLAPSCFPQGQEDAKQQAREVFKQLVEINTTDSVGNVTTAAEALATRLRDAGFPDQDVIVDGPNARKKNLTVRLHGTSRQKPVLFLAHLDVVEARREDWTTDPFQFIEKDGYFYGRGTVDIKDGAAILVTNLIRTKKPVSLQTAILSSPSRPTKRAAISMASSGCSTIIAIGSTRSTASISMAAI